jgi:hypothetical protein
VYPSLVPNIECQQAQNYEKYNNGDPVSEKKIENKTIQGIPRTLVHVPQKSAGFDNGGVVGHTVSHKYILGE